MRSAEGLAATIMVYAATAFVLCNIAYMNMDPTENGSAPLIAGGLQILIFGAAAQAFGKARRTRRQTEKAATPA